MQSRQTSSKDKFYHGMCESPVKKKNRSLQHLGLSEPSVSRVQSQQYIDLANSQKKAGLPKKQQKTTYPVVKPVKQKKTKTTSIKREDESDNETPPTNDAKTLTEQYPDPPRSNTEEKVISCSLKTTSYGLKKQSPKKKSHSYRCPTCKEQFRKLALLNDHYKNKQPPLLCEDCTKEFCTLSALERHAYLHKSLDYTCTVCEK